MDDSCCTCLAQGLKMCKDFYNRSTTSPPVVLCLIYSTVHIKYYRRGDNFLCFEHVRTIGTVVKSIYRSLNFKLVPKLVEGHLCCTVILQLSQVPPEF